MYYVGTLVFAAKTFADAFRGRIEVVGRDSGATLRFLSAIVPTRNFLDGQIGDRLLPFLEKEGLSWYCTVKSAVACGGCLRNCILTQRTTRALLSTLE
jgi:hypothetical protein